MATISRFISELWMLFREMYGLEIVAGIVFFSLGLLLVKTMAAAHAERIRSGLEEQARLKEAVAALRGGMGGAVPTTSPRKSPPESRKNAGNKKGGKLFRETEAAAGDWLEGGKGASRDVKSAKSVGHAKDVTEAVRAAKSDQPHLSGEELVGKITPSGQSSDGGSKVKAIPPKKDSKAEIADQLVSAEAPALSAYETAVDAFAGEEGVTIDRELGSIFSKKPKAVDDLKAIKGIGAKIERQLHAAGIYRIAQIAHWNDRNAEAIGAQLRFQGRVEREEWIPQAKLLCEANMAKPEVPKSTVSKKKSGGVNLKSSVQKTVGGSKGSEVSAQKAAAEKFVGEDITVDKELGVLFGRRPKKVDDLTKIKGIGKVLNGRLNKSGIYRFQQIALWTPEMVEAFSKRLKSFQDRMRRERWIEQATKLHREEYGE